MNRALQWKLIAGFFLVFLAGGVTGAFVGAAHARHFFFMAPRPAVISERMRERLQRELNLTPEQVTKISPVLDKAAAELHQVRRDTGRRVHEIIAETHRQMAGTLTDDQRGKLQQIEERHRRWHHGHGPHGPPPETSPSP
jgi:Spy/CpxP family protein refolding chaperone